MSKFIPGQIIFVIPDVCTDHTTPQIAFYRSGEKRITCDYRGLPLVLDSSNCFALVRDAEDALWNRKRQEAPSGEEIEVSFDV